VSKWKVKEVDLDRVDESQENANKMSGADYKKLKQNIDKSGMSTVITCFKKKDDGRFEIIGGNHRRRAMIDLGYQKTNVIYAKEDDLSSDEITAIKLSLNSLHGDHDKSILAKLFKGIESVEFKEFANIGSKDLEVGDIFQGSIIPMSEHFKVTLILYKKDMELLKELLEITEEDVRKSDLVIIADGDESEGKFLRMVTKAKKKFKVKSISVGFGKVLDMAKKGLEEE